MMSPQEVTYAVIDTVYSIIFSRKDQAARCASIVEAWQKLTSGLNDSPILPRQPVAAGRLPLHLNMLQAGMVSTRNYSERFFNSFPTTPGKDREDSFRLMVLRMVAIISAMEDFHELFPVLAAAVSDEPYVSRRDLCVYIALSDGLSESFRGHFMELEALASLGRSPNPIRRMLAARASSRALPKGSRHPVSTDDSEDVLASRARVDFLQQLIDDPEPQIAAAILRALPGQTSPEAMALLQKLLKRFSEAGDSVMVDYAQQVIARHEQWIALKKEGK